jgi:UDP-2,4-diacetamido-2,4,6-trideoxy-beta-L-altropyranose hydrolase
MRIGFRVDASTRIGAGHAVRCTALAVELRRLDASCTFSFYSRRLPGDLREWFASQGFDVVTLGESAGPAGAADAPPWAANESADAEATTSLLRQQPRPDWMVVDHYGLGSSWESAMVSVGARVAAIDDLADRSHQADLLVDQNLQPSRERYAGLVPRRCRQLLGPRYALLRSEFAAARGTRPHRRPATARARVLACVGGSDPNDFLSRVLDAWQAWPGEAPRLDMAIGATSPNVDKLRLACATMEDVTLHVQPTSMAALMAEADLFVGSAGGVSWERCCAGLPGVFGRTVENQRLNDRLLAERRTGVSVGDWAKLAPARIARLTAALLARPSLLARMARRAAAVCDGRGAERVAVALLAERVHLRRATPEDAERVWPWRDAPSSRRHSTDPRPLPLGEHLAWWSHALQDPTRDLLIAEVGSRAVGVIRFDRNDAEATVSIYLDPGLTGLGLGRHILEAGRRQVADTAPQVATLFADILPANRASASAFAEAGYVQVGARWNRRVNE